MNIAGLLFQLQGLDLEIDSAEKSLLLAALQLADRSALDEAGAKLVAARQHHEAVAKQQRGLETEIDDIAAKLKPAETKLYGGQVRNPKELGDLQRETVALKAKTSTLENEELETMEQLERSSAELVALEGVLKAAQAEWQNRQQRLAAEMQTTKTALAALKQQRDTLAAGIDPQAVSIYEEARKKRGTAVAKVEQGLCQGCRIALPMTELQKARRGSLVRCGSCGRILYLA